MIMLAMTILVHFWVLYGAIVPSTRTTRPNLRHYTSQPSHMAHTKPAGSLVREGRLQVQNVSVAIKVRSRYRVVVTYAK